MFEHEKLVAYAKSLDAAVELHRLARTLPPGLADLRDQLMRAGFSIPLNIAEGAGEYSSPEKARFYRIARRSGAECAAILDVAERIVGAPFSAAAARVLLSQVCAMLTNLIKSRTYAPPLPHDPSAAER